MRSRQDGKVVNTKLISVMENEIEAKDALLREAGDILRSGGLVAIPTETVYGLGGDGLNKESSRRIYEAKGRPSDNPLIIHVADMESVERIVREISPEARKVAEAFWPGPLTMIFPKADIVPYETTGGLDTVAVRMPSHKVARRVIAYGGGYVAAPSANTSGKPSPTLAKYVMEDMDGKIDMVIDGGEGDIGLESTILDMTVSPPQILRPGFVTGEMLEKVLGEIAVDCTILRNDTGERPRAPGMKYRHYAPRGELTIISGSEAAVIEYINNSAKKAMAAGKTVGIIGSDEMIAGYMGSSVKSVGSKSDELSIGKSLYRILREFDEENIDVIYSESFGREGMGQAIMNRLLKAAGHQVIEV